MSLSEYVGTLGSGPGRSRSLTQEEAHAAMRLMLSGNSAPEAVGALLMLLRMKGETAEEIAGFAAATQDFGPKLPQADLDWPSYAAGRTRGAPWFLLSAKQIADAGHRVLIHGWNSNVNAVRDGLSEVGIKVARTSDQAHDFLDGDNIAYLPLEDHFPALHALLDLRAVLGLRSCMNTVCRMLNPGQASASVQGVFHPSYRLLQADAAALLGWRNLSVIKGGGGEFELYPAKTITCFGLRGGMAWEGARRASVSNGKRLTETMAHWPPMPDLPAFESAIIQGTTALAMETLEVAPSKTCHAA